MEGGEEDLFGFLIKFCEPTSSQELKLRNCPFALESQTFPDAVDSLPSQFSPTPTPSGPPGIVMVSPPETDSGDEDASIDKSTPQENEQFHTPPEYHNLSSSSQEEPQQPPKPIVAVDAGVERVAIDDGCGENEVNFDLGTGGENLGFPETEELEGGDVVFGGDSREGKKKVEGIEGVESELKRLRVFEGELDEPVLKKIRVSEENWDLETQTVCIGEIDEGIGHREDKIVINVDLAEEESEENDGVNENGEMQKICEGISDGENDSEGEIEKLKYNSSGGIDNPGAGKGVVLDGGEKGLLTNVDLAVEASEEGFRNNGNHEVRKNSVSFRNIEEIEQFKYKGSGDSGDQCWKEVVRRRRELPLSMREKGNDAGEKERVGNVDVKNLSWKDLLDALAVIFGKVDDGSEDVDFLEVAKRRGMTFPQPRWM